MNMEELKQAFRQVSRFDELLGMQFEIYGPGEIEYSLIVQEKHLSSPKVCHGGVLAAMMDAVLGLPVLSLAVADHKVCATVEFKINYLGPAYLGDSLVGTQSLEFKGQSLVVSSGEIRNGASGQPLAKGLGTFSLYPAGKNTLFPTSVKNNPER